MFQVELDQEKGLEMRKWVLSGILASEETYISQLEALLIVRLIQVTFISVNYSLGVCVLATTDSECVQPAYEAPESRSHHLTTDADHPADRDHLL